MPALSLTSCAGADSAVSDDNPYFAKIADDLANRSWSVINAALPPDMSLGLLSSIQQHNEAEFTEAGTGRSRDHQINPFVRRDRIRWINGENLTEQAWLEWASSLQHYLNRRLFLGLFSFESHYAHYGSGDFYKKHVDAFRPNGIERGARREVSLVTYLNPAWQPEDGGELLIYDASGQEVVERVLPRQGTVVVFLSTEVPHEVLPAKRDRYSIAGWFRLNGSQEDRPDPPS
ncbi:prolyl 4-hydroxylase subunit alpha [Pseudohongiella nitratireducens]|uniref:Prolyl 4-hydroxylase subunit alpha n=1 Tax=Pseudohongiella nitratireducens TaxID=1768907 RepID=A0A917GN70_9GAMM|nr:2OG-Fe(II) oxygenase [Pseudohongiella nitratireducens]GGG52423.1 prolyl 4-hydroxylase subunit alpha [Pseudohongiella nitratireducens]